MENRDGRPRIEADRDCVFLSPGSRGVRGRDENAPLGPGIGNPGGPGLGG